MALDADTDVLNELSSLMQREFFPSDSSPSPPPPPGPYIYSRIPSDRRIIRLLTLLPPDPTSSSPPFSQPLRGRLDYAPLAFAPEFDALSYAWGSTEKPFVLQLVPSSSSSSFPSSTSSFLPITASVDAALRRLRDNPEIRRNGRWKLWIDAICIDQSDDVEKSWQVALMSDIFSAAERVLCWIGEDEQVRSLDDEGDDGGGDGGMAKATFDLLLDLGKVSFAGLGTEEGYADELMASKGIPPKGHGTWTAVGSFFTRPWFRRGWILQEVYFARKAIIVCGNEHVELGFITTGIGAVFDHNLLKWGLERLLSPEELAGLSSFRTLMHQISTKTMGRWIGYHLAYVVNNDGNRPHYDMIEEWLRGVNVDLPRFIEHVRAVLKLLGVPLRYHPDITGAMFDTILKASGASKAVTRLPHHTIMRMYPGCVTTDPRDQFFALLNMSSDKDAPALRVDYTESVEVVQLRYARYFLLESRDVLGLRPKNLLTFAGIFTGQFSTGLPSWVPNFWTIESDVDEIMPGTSSLSRLQYHAAAGSEIKHRPIVDQLGEIIVVGNTVDIVSYLVYNPLAEENYGDIDVSRYFAEIDRIVDHDEPYPIFPHESRLEAMWRTLIGNIGMDMGTPPMSYESLYRRHRSRLEADCMQGLYESGRNPAGITNDWGSCWASMAVAGLQLCETEAGFIGLAPRGAEIGDSICIILGESMPLLLRPCDDKPEKHRLIGSCYIHGLMQGEAMMSEDWMERDIHLV